MRELTITEGDHRWHGAFHDYVGRVFPGVSFRRWAESGGWRDGYRVFALLDGERMVAGVGLTRMQVLLLGRQVRGWQLGAVGTDPEYRGRGLQRRLLEHVLAEPGSDDLVFLFANEKVLNFYPRFGFRRVKESGFAAEHRAQPSGAPLRVLRADNADDRALLSRAAASAGASTTVFGARGYGSILLWYAYNFHGQHVRYLPDEDALVVAEQAGTTLIVYDVLTSAPIDLARYLPRLITAPIERLDFRYTPERHWPRALPTRHDQDCPLFVRGPIELPRQPFKFPALAQT